MCWQQHLIKTHHFYDLVDSIGLPIPIIGPRSSIWGIQIPLIRPWSSIRRIFQIENLVYCSEIPVVSSDNSTIAALD